MAIIVRYKGNDGHYILLGAGFGVYKSARPSAFLGSIVPVEETGELPVVAICDYEGTVTWVRSESIEVVSVDGRPPSEILGSV